MISRLLRRLVRRTFKPISQSKSETWRMGLSAAYLFFAWTACGLILYQAKNKYQRAPGQSFHDQAKHFAHNLNLQSATIISIDKDGAKTLKWKKEDPETSDFGSQEGLQAMKSC